jgi:hypothetical protein
MKRMFLVVVWVLMTSCVAKALPVLPEPTLPDDRLPRNIAVEATTTQVPPATPTRQRKPISPITPVARPLSTATAASVVPTLDPLDWKTWPIIPEAVDPTLRNVYERGLELGNDPHAFSIFGDCQQRPGEFFGRFETDQELVESLPQELRETVDYFHGSFNRESPTAQDGTTPGSLLWNQWHRGEYGCSLAETPVECELRIHRPSFVIIQIGTHFESRNTEYLRDVITQLMDAGVVPILATKADNREKDERINRDMAMLASEYDLPLWNFWAAVSDLPGRGLYTRDDRPLQGPIYLTEDAGAIHRMTGLEALNTVWRVIVQSPR